VPVEEVNVEDLCGGIVKSNFNYEDDNGEVTLKFSTKSGMIPKSYGGN